MLRALHTACAVAQPQVYQESYTGDTVHALQVGLSLQQLPASKPQELLMHVLTVII